MSKQWNIIGEKTDGTPSLKAELSRRTVRGVAKGGYMGIYTPKSVRIDFLWGKNDVKMVIDHEY